VYIFRVTLSHAAAPQDVHRPASRPAGRQARKTERTRARLLEATLALIREHGFAAATAGRIARRAGVTWGAAQHQFGSKDDILDAVLALAYERFIAAMSAPALRRGPLGARVRRLVQAMWLHYQSDHYRVSLEILRATRNRQRARARAWEQRQGRAHLQVVRGVFPELCLSDARLHSALTFTHCCLTGLALEGLFERHVRHVGEHLTHISAALTGMLARAPRRARRQREPGG
jgi:AcrR family transcriptional regulator